MPLLRSSFCRVDPAPGWKVFSDRDSIRLKSPGDDASLQFTRLDPSTMEGGITRWIQACEHSDRLKGRPVDAITLLGGLHGHTTSFRTDTEWLRGWTLATPDLGIDVTYRCPLSAAGRDDSEVDAMLASLTVPAAHA